MSKRLFSLIVIGIIAVSLLASCGAGSGENQTGNSTQSVQAIDEAELEKETGTSTIADTGAGETSMESTEGNESEGKTLVVYYSATGNTEQVANMIAEVTGADLFKLEPVEPYTDTDLDWTDDNSRVSREHGSPDQREVELLSTTVDDWDSVSTVYIGYPIWWAVASFIEANDFAGKTVIPFCTSSSSGLGESGELLAELAGTGDWQEGMRFSSGASKEDVVTWVEGLGL